MFKCSNNSRRIEVPRFDMQIHFLSAFWCDDIVTSRLGKSTPRDLPMEKLAPQPCRAGPQMERTTPKRTLKLVVALGAKKSGSGD